MAEWERVRRLDAAWAVAGLAAQAGVRLVVEGPCPGGQVGAAYVRWPDGHRSVLTWQPDRSLAEVRAGPLAVLESARRVGHPAPVIELAAQVGDAVVLVQEVLPGRPVGRVSHELLDQVLALVERQAGALAGRPEVPAVRLFLAEDGPGYCRHGPLRRHGPRAAALERWVREVGERLPGDVLPGDDAVHLDLQPGNLLAVDGVVTGVVDWDGAGRGDRRLDLVTLRFGLPAVDVDGGVVERLDAALDTATQRPCRCWCRRGRTWACGWWTGRSGTSHPRTSTGGSTSPSSAPERHWGALLPSAGVPGSSRAPQCRLGTRLTRRW